MTHAHEWVEFAEFKHAPIADHDPIAHTAFRVIVCGCGVWHAFPEQNHALTTAHFQYMVQAMMRYAGYHPQQLVDEVRALDKDGATHDCGEWKADQRCVICGRSFAS